MKACSSVVHLPASSSSTFVANTNKVLTYKHVSVVTSGEIQILRLLTAVLHIVSGDLNGERNDADPLNSHGGWVNELFLDS